MVDHVSKVRRSQIMSSIKGRDTRPEIIIRKILYAAGYRYRLHVKDLPGKPDIVMRKYNAIILVHGCFWHGHICNMSRSLPKTQNEFWQNKINKNKARDTKVIQELHDLGWRVCIVWNCALERRGKLPPDILLRRISKWIDGNKKNLIIEGNFKGN